MEQDIVTLANGRNGTSVPADDRTEESARRHALALLYTGTVVWEWDLLTDIVRVDNAFYEMFELEPGRTVVAQDILNAIHPEDLPAVQEALEACFERRAPLYDIRFRIPLIAGGWRWLRGKGQVLERGANDEPLKVIGINYDETEQVQIEERLETIAAEMRHRVKNSLAMVNALASATARETHDLKEFMERFRGRVSTIAAAQNIGVAGSSLTLLDALQAGLSPFLESAEWRDRISVDADRETLLTDSLAQSVTLCIYEFATNAVKYGALGEGEGTVAVKAAAGDDKISINWEEFTPGRTAELLTTGFGSTLVDRLARAERGTVERRSEAEKLFIKLSFPANRD